MSEFATVSGLIATLLLALTWVGYPLVMEILARLSRRPPHKAVDTEAPFVSIVVATRGPADLVTRRIANLKTTSYPAHRYEIVVGIDRVAAEELATLGESSGDLALFVFDAESPGKPSALNAAVAASHGEVLVFADSAQAFEADAIGKLISSLSDPSVGVVSGQLSLSPDAERSLVGLYWKMERRLRSNEARVHSAVGVTGAIYAMRRELFAPVPQDTILDDVYVPMRAVLAGHRVDFNRDARATDERAYSVTREKDRKERTLTGVLQLCAQLPALLSPSRNPLWIQFLMHKLLRLASPILLLVMLPWVVLSATHILSVLPGTVSRWVSGALVVLAVFALVVPRSRALLQEFLLINWAVLKALVRAARRDWGVW